MLDEGVDAKSPPSFYVGRVKRTQWSNPSLLSPLVPTTFMYLVPVSLSLSLSLACNCSYVFLSIFNYIMYTHTLSLFLSFFRSLTLQSSLGSNFQFFYRVSASRNSDSIIFSFRNTSPSLASRVPQLRLESISLFELLLKSSVLTSPLSWSSKVLYSRFNLTCQRHSLWTACLKVTNYLIFRYASFLMFSN